MNTIIQKIEADSLNQNSVNSSELNQAAQILKNGGLVAFPTETVYGLGADGMNPTAAKKIYEAKGRPSDNPLILHIAEIQTLNDLVEEIPEKAKKLAAAFWPGPLTMIFKKRKEVPYGTTGGLDTVAIRMPKHPVALALIRCSRVAIAAPSANLSGKPSPTKAEHVIDDLSGKIDLILDGGSVGIGLESTIVDMTVEPPMILRPGYITKAMLEQKIGKVTVDEAIISMQPVDREHPKAPGMKYKHYAPKGDLTIFEGESEKVIAEINRHAREQIQEGYCVGILATEETKQRYLFGEVKTVGSRSEEESIARGLYSVLREFDDCGAEFIYAESFGEGDLGQAIMNRLLKAAGYKVERL